MKHEHKGESVKYERERGAHVEHYQMWVIVLLLMLLLLLTQN